MEALFKEAHELTVQDVYDMSYVIGRELVRVRGGARDVSDLQFQVVRVLELLEALVSGDAHEKRDAAGDAHHQQQQQQTVGPDQLVVDLRDPNRPRFTLQELKEVLQERNQLKAQLLLAHEELQMYKRGASAEEVDIEALPTLEPSLPVGGDDSKEKSSIHKLFSFKKK